MYECWYSFLLGVVTQTAGRASPLRGRYSPTGKDPSGAFPAENVHNADLWSNANFSNEWLPLRSSFWQMLARWLSTVR